VTTPSNDDADRGIREWLREQLLELERVARLSEKAYGRWRRRYESMHYLLGVPATILAAVASISAFSDGSAQWVAGLLAGASAAMVGVQTLVRPDHKAKFNQQQQFVIARIAFDALALRSTQLDQKPVESVTTRLRDLQERYFAAREQAAP
jgi:hypothetical protein